MSESEVSVVMDNDGIAVVGEKSAVQKFLENSGFDSLDLNMGRMSKAAGHAGSVLQAGSDISANYGR